MKVSWNLKDGNDKLPRLKVESYAWDDDDDDAVTDASDSYTKPAMKNRSGRIIHMPKKYDGIEMTAAEIDSCKLYLA